MSSYSIKTPHAAMLVWNYRDRVGVPKGDFDAVGINKEDLTKVEGSKNEDEQSVSPVIVSTLSCVSIQTQKTKNRPDGSFRVVLAPFKNWVSTLTPGSWCVLLMSNQPITEKDLKRAHRSKVKMFGRIESVRCETKADANGVRQTLYYVTGTDWGDVFNSVLYVDNLIKGPQDKGNDQGDVAAIALRKLLFDRDGAPRSFNVRKNLRGILDIMGRDLSQNTADKKDIGRLANSVYSFVLPKPVIEYFDFKDSKNNRISKDARGNTFNKFVALKTGWLTGQDIYSDASEADGFVNPFSLQGSNSMWQILLENSNPALNEMLCDFRWSNDNSVQFAVYNRIKPFSYKNYKANAGVNGTIGSYFQNVKLHKLNDNEVISVNAGTNWRDKINFIEIKPQFQDFNIIQNWIKQKVQVFDENSFQREGFRSLIVDTKQFPSRAQTSSDPNDIGIDWTKLRDWALMMREWYFGTHRMLNGTIVLHGISEYIGVGDNIRFHTGLINPTSNMSKDMVKNGHAYILAHVESIQHDFIVGQNGARSYITTIQFVRGITVKQNNELVSEGMLDQDVTSVSQSQDRNRVNTVNTSHIPSDPDPQKVRGN